MNGLFLIDDSKDADTEENKTEADARAKSEGSGSNTPKVQRPNYSAEQIEKMKKWTDGTFTEDELADFRKRCLGTDYVDVIENIDAEYVRRKAIF